MPSQQKRPTAPWAVLTGEEAVDGGEGLSPSTQCSSDTSRIPCPFLYTPLPTKYRKVGACSAESHQDGQGWSTLPCEERLRDWVWFSLGQRRLWKDLTAAPQHVWSSQQEDSARIFTALHIGRTRDKGLKLKQEAQAGYKETLPHEDSQALDQVTQ